MNTPDDLPSTGNGRFYDRPVLVVDAGMHTSVLKQLDADREGRFLVTASEDKTVRVWDATNGGCRHTLRLPAGPGNVGKANAVAISPDGAFVAAAGWTLLGNHPVYLFDSSSGQLLHQVDGSPEVVHHLVFSPDGTKLIAALGYRRGIRLIDLTPDPKSARIVRVDENYGDQCKCATFDPVGRIATTGLDGLVRFYDRNLRRLHAIRMPEYGGPPYGIAFSPDGRWLAVGCGWPADIGWPPALHVFQVLKQKSGKLGYRFSADTRRLLPGILMAVAWSADGGTLYAGGSCPINADEKAIRSWRDGGRGVPHDESLAQNSIVGIRPLPEGRLAFAAADPRVGVIGPDRHMVWSTGPVTNDFRDPTALLAVSADGERVHYRHDRWNQARRAWGKTDTLLSVRGFRLTEEARPHDLAPPRASAPGLAVEGWCGGYGPTLNGKLLPLELRERSRSLAIAPDGTRFLLGSEWWLRMLDREGEVRWQRVVPAAVCAVNITGDGRLVIAAHEDGTIRWYRADDGIELLSFLPLADRTKWAMWTPDGFHVASSEAHGVVRWHLNRGQDEAPESIPIADIPKLHRPDLLPLILEELDVSLVVGRAGLSEAREAVQHRVSSSIPPGAQLHVFAVGISTYNQANAAHLRLKFARDDAHDLFTALESTQSGLYTAVNQQILLDEKAEGKFILTGLSFLRDLMEAGNGQDLAVIFFSGHGALIEGEPFLLPHDVDARTPALVQATALNGTVLASRVYGLSNYGRVLVLVDACRSGAITRSDANVPLDATVLRTQLGGPASVAVLTSSSGTEKSREEQKWANGAFTEALIEALRGAADIDRNGLISVTELTRYLDARVRQLTGGHQHPGFAVRFEASLFAAGL